MHLIQALICVCVIPELITNMQASERREFLTIFYTFSQPDSALSKKYENKENSYVTYKKIVNDFEIESKYHRKLLVLFSKAQIFSSQDVGFRSMFFLIFY